ncbi:MAG: iron-sulfur cluster assembly scaffold protein [Thermoplasmata archaeon]|nr:iron-sulfur cluster assembly scaffold protein [Thermoplasmata archaeon]
MYQELILQHYRSPQNFGTLEHPDLSGQESNPLCGDHITLQLGLDASRLRIDAVRFSGDGCAISVAATSLLTQKLRGLSLEDAGRLTREDVLQLLAIPLSPVRVKCALTGFAALGRALHPPTPSGSPGGTITTPVEKGSA